MSLDITLMVEVDLGGPEEPHEFEVWWKNITHSVVPMWNKAGVYDALYRSDGKQAQDIIPYLERGLEKMKENPSEYEALNPANGWGSYSGAVDFLEDYLCACHLAPLAIVRVSA